MKQTDVAWASPDDKLTLVQDGTRALNNAGSGRINLGMGVAMAATVFTCWTSPIRIPTTEPFSATSTTIHGYDDLGTPDSLDGSALISCSRGNDNLVAAGGVMGSAGNDNFWRLFA